MTEQEPIVAKFTPHSEGAFIRGVPQRDLTQVDLDRLDALTRRDALAPHPRYGAPLYTLTPEGEAWQQAIDDELAERVAGIASEAEATIAEQPKWYRDKLDKAQAAGESIPPRDDGETQKDYETRVFATAAQQAAGASADAARQISDAINGPAGDGADSESGDA